MALHLKACTYLVSLFARCNLLCEHIGNLTLSQVTLLSSAAYQSALVANALIQLLLHAVVLLLQVCELLLLCTFHVVTRDLLFNMTNQ
jgi:hypothetical protein